MHNKLVRVEALWPASQSQSSYDTTDFVCLTFTERSRVVAVVHLLHRNDIDGDGIMASRTSNIIDYSDPSLGGRDVVRTSGSIGRSKIHRCNSNSMRSIRSLQIIYQPSRHWTMEGGTYEVVTRS